MNKTLGVINYSFNFRRYIGVQWMTFFIQTFSKARKYDTIFNNSTFLWKASAYLHILVQSFSIILFRGIYYFWDLLDVHRFFGLCVCKRKMVSEIQPTIASNEVFQRQQTKIIMCLMSVTHFCEQIFHVAHDFFRIYIVIPFCLRNLGILLTTKALKF